MNGNLSYEQAEALKLCVIEKEVYDLGAGDLTLSHQILAMGARRVIAVDCEYRNRRPATAIEGMPLIGCYFEEFYPREIEIAFMSWPENHKPIGLERLASMARHVVYLGSTFGGTMCGTRGLWEHLITRDVLSWVPDERNSLIIYGPRRTQRALLPDERAALDDERIHVWPARL